MDARGSAGAAGSHSHFDRLSDDLVLRILIEASDLYDHSSEHAFASLSLLCPLRAVCSRFDKLIPEVDRLFFDDGEHASKLLCFLHERAAVKSFAVNAGHLPLLLLQGVLGATPQLERLMIVSAFQPLEAGDPDERLQDVFRSLSGCHQLQSLELNCLRDAAAAFCEALSSRHQLRRLTMLSLTEVNIDDAWLSSITRVCPSLEKLHLEDVSGLSNLVIASQSLTSITFKTNNDNTDNSFIDLLEIEAPQLLVLHVASVIRLTLHVPRLQELHFNWACNVVKQTEWQLSTLKIKGACSSLGNLLHNLSMCNEALKVLTIEKPYKVVSLAAKKDKEKLLEVFQSFKHLEELHVPSNLSKFLTAKQGAAMIVEPLADLKRLKIGFEKLNGLFNLCLALIKLLPKLERLDIDLTNIVQSNAAIDDLVADVLRLQKLRPSLNLVVEWPGHSRI